MSSENCIITEELTSNKHAISAAAEGINSRRKY